MRRAIALFLSLTLVSLAPVAAAQNDGGAGADAPAQRANALPVAGTSFSGELRSSQGDEADWYYLTGIPAGMGAEVTITVAGIRDVIIYLYDANGAPFQRNADGALISGYNFEPWGSAGSGTFDIVGTPGPFYVGVVEDFFSNEGTYEFSFELRPLVDVAVEGLAAEPVEIESDAGTIPASVVRLVDVTVRGGGATADVLVDVWATPVGGATTARRHVGAQTVRVAPGEVRVLTFEWSTVGQAGDFDLRARASTFWEAALENNEAVLRQRILVGSVGLGVDALNHRVAAQGASVGTSWGRGIGAQVDTPAPVAPLTFGAYDP